MGPEAGFKWFFGEPAEDDVVRRNLTEHRDFSQNVADPMEHHRLLETSKAKFRPRDG